MLTQTSASAEWAFGRLRTAYGIVRVTASSRGLREVWLPRWTGEAGDGGRGGAPDATADAAPHASAASDAAREINRGGDASTRRLLEQALDELDEYFAGARRAFTVALDPVGTAFLQRVWRAVAAVPYGETRSYGEIAQVVGVPGAARAVGRANAINPLAPIVPCHRIVGSDGRLTGYGPGLPMKWRLLRMEDALPADAGDYDTWIARLLGRLPSDAPRHLYLGIRPTHTYCETGCERSRARADRPGRVFLSPEEAIAAGFAPCSVCRPAGATSISRGARRASHRD